jgi:hypothetical protein
MLGTCPCNISMDPNQKLLKDEGKSSKILANIVLVRKMNYLTTTKLDISYVVSVVSHLLEVPTVPQWNDVTHFSLLEVSSWSRNTV